MASIMNGSPRVVGAHHTVPIKHSTGRLASMRFLNKVLPGDPDLATSQARATAAALAIADAPLARPPNATLHLLAVS